MNNIEQFKTSYLSLNINVPTIVHAVFYHVIDFCSAYKKGLCAYSEEAMKSVYYDHRKKWEEKYKASPEKDTYDKYSLRSGCDYNCKHL